MSSNASLRHLLTALLLACPALGASGQAATPPAAESDAQATVDVLTPAQAKAVDRTIDRALAWLASRQQPDGSFPTLEIGQPAVTALCVMAFAARGHLPGHGPYGARMDRALDYILDSQTPEGVISRSRPSSQQETEKAQTVYYNHSISGLVLAELYGQCSSAHHARIRPVIEKALPITLSRQPRPKRNRADEGGWRYIGPHQDSDSDLSMSSWALMFLRSCRNAGFDVPAQPIDEAIAYVTRCYDPQQHIFWYALRGREHVTTRAMTGAGILSLSMGGRHRTQQALEAGDWLLANPFDQYLERTNTHDRFFYGAFYCSQAMFQLGCRYWREFYPVLSRTLVEAQGADGSWQAELGYDRIFGNVYSTALGVLALSPPCQLLPIFQR